ncbi:MAG: hypothetical protein M3R13_01570 [Armatimonadota bacterium]|nr:hypothetical protein [Armatimonadota bacterium]
MKLTTKIAAFAAAGAVGIGLVAMPPNATASEEGRRNTAYALGAATLYFGIKKKTIPAIVGAAGTAYAVKRMQDRIDDRHDRERAARSSRSSSSSSASSNYSSGGSSVRRAGSSGGRSTASARGASRSHSQLANNSYVQSLISSAYTKGSKFGYQSGYEAGLSEGYKKGFDAGSGASGSTFKPTGNSLAASQNETSAGNLYARIMEAH